MLGAFVIVPGIGGSGPDHWQSHWAASWPGAIRFQPASWDEPDLDDWVASLDSAIAASAAAPVLICHSLGCLLFAHWRARSNRDIAAAFLVAIPDPEAPTFPRQARAFGMLPQGDLGDRPVLAIGSTDDPYDPSGRGLAWARSRRAMSQMVGPHGHLNAVSGLGAWPAGQALLATFLKQVPG